MWKICGTHLTDKYWRLSLILQTVLEGFLFHFEMLRIFLFGLTPLQATYFGFLGSSLVGPAHPIISPPLYGGYCTGICLLRTFYSFMVVLQPVGVLFMRVAQSLQRIYLFISLLQWRLDELFVDFLRSHFGQLTWLQISCYSFLTSLLSSDFSVMVDAVLYTWYFIQQARNIHVFQE